MQIFLMPNVNELLFRMQLTVAYQPEEEIQKGTQVTKEENQGVIKACVGMPKLKYSESEYYMNNEISLPRG